jgi:hypothetical protein
VYVSFQRGFERSLGFDEDCLRCSCVFLQGVHVPSEGALAAVSQSLIVGLPGSATYSRVVSVFCLFLVSSPIFLCVTCPGCFQLLAAYALYGILVLQFVDFVMHGNWN